MKYELEDSRKLKEQFNKDIVDPKFFIPAELQTETSGVMNYRALVTAVRLPSGAIEIATNTEELESKIMDIQSRYDENFELLPGKKVRIVGYMLI